jgi:hypothetical protein
LHIRLRQDHAEQAYYRQHQKKQVAGPAMAMCGCHLILPAIHQCQ